MYATIPIRRNVSLYKWKEKAMKRLSLILVATLIAAPAPVHAINVRQLAGAGLFGLTALSAYSTYLDFCDTGHVEYLLRQVADTVLAAVFTGLSIIVLNVLKKAS